MRYLSATTSPIASVCDGLASAAAPFPSFVCNCMIESDLPAGSKRGNGVWHVDETRAIG